jgi:hypothetical protein
MPVELNFLLLMCFWRLRVSSLFISSSHTVFLTYFSALRSCLFSCILSVSLFTPSSCWAVKCPRFRPCHPCVYLLAGLSYPESLFSPLLVCINKLFTRNIVWYSNGNHIKSLRLHIYIYIYGLRKMRTPVNAAYKDNFLACHFWHTWHRFASPGLDNVLPSRTL